MSSLIETFKDEALELLQELEAALLELEESPQDLAPIDRVFRALHTLKGSGGLAGFESVAGFCHEAETVFELVRSGERQVDQDLVSLTLSAQDHIKGMILAEFGGEPVGEDLTAELVAAFQSLQPFHSSEVEQLSSSAETQSEQQSTYRIRFRPNPGLFRQGVQPQFLLSELARLGESLVVAQFDAVPALDELDPEECWIYWDVLLTTAEDEDTIRDVFIFVEDDCELIVQKIDEGGQLDQTEDYKRLGEILVERGDLTREDLEKYLKGKKLLGETLVQEGAVNDGKVQSALVEQERIQALRRERKSHDVLESIRVKSDRLDKLINLVGEMVTVQARLSQLANNRVDADLLSVAEEVERLIWDLRDQVLTIRMLPISGTFTRFKRLVRDLGTELEKDVVLITEGGETELDKSVIDQLNDPLVHLVRNSIGHGIESPGVRQAIGKPGKGRITLSAKHSGAHVVLTVVDDGAGLDVEKIRAKAIEKGLINAQAELTDREIYALIFEPGFSTVETVSNVSGRGVGMDVVRRAIDALRGTIEVRSEAGQGTTFSLKLPLTLAIIDGLLIDIASVHYVLPLSAVEECIELSRADAEQSHGRNLVKVRGEIVPYVRLRDEFKIKGQCPEIEQVVIANLEGLRVGFVVDHVVGEHQTVIKNLGRMYQDIEGVSGATILGDGRVALILDLPQLAEKAEDEERRNNR
ncbi:MAG: chemotaxis protein CheA [Deltaproteobacteria bacterium]|nr:MAG: chemotaxis protein CheA [Deltaproteobacteria bacterium]